MMETWSLGRRDSARSTYTRRGRASDSVISSTTPHGSSLQISTTASTRLEVNQLEEHRCPMKCARFQLDHMFVLDFDAKT